MQVFDPRQIHVPSGHFIGGERVQDAARLTVLRPSDGQAHAELPIADAAMVDAALAAGNAVVLKPSELTPWSAIRLAELAIQAGMPAGLFNVVQGDGQTTGDALSRHPLISKMTFTGSTRTGAAIMAACAMSGPKPVTLELGGKSPQLVFGDVPDIERLAKLIAGAITGNAGQVCVAGSRLIVQRGIAEALVDRLVARFGSLRPGATWDDEATLSPIISAQQAQRMLPASARTWAGRRSRPTCASKACWWISARRTEVHGARIDGTPHAMPRHPLQTAAFMRRALDFPTTLAALHAAIDP